MQSVTVFGWQGRDRTLNNYRATL
uniref:Uncharacterized protein n=1 Tax=Arundo donax TaxID=35708 RepID=A0A0A9HT55_ARUDO